jgi:hypothetical protein
VTEAAAISVRMLLSRFCHTVPMATDRRYSDHLDILLALVTYLALTQWRSRSPAALAQDLGLDETEITLVLKGFPGLFRENPDPHPTAAGSQPSYTLYGRYARRRLRDADSLVAVATPAVREPASNDPVPDQDGSGEELDADSLRMLLDFVSDRARAEQQTRQSHISQLWLILGVSIAAIASITAALIQAFK